MMKVGFTGPRTGMTTTQADVFLVQLHALGATELHHGDCRGADEQAHAIARSIGLKIVGHPPTSNGMRAFCDFDEMRPPAPFLVRDHAIVRETQILVGTPDGPERRRSGTWTTIRYAARLHFPRMIIAPDGVVTLLDLTLDLPL